MMRLIGFGLFAVLLLAGGLFAAEVNNPYGEEDFLTQPRASREHDRVTIVIQESSSARNEATTETTKESSAEWSFANLFKITKDKDGDVIAVPFPDARKPTLNVESTREHAGEGETEASNTAETTISGEVIEVMPNGHLVVEATSSIRVNNEIRQVIFAGRVDPRDLAADNSVNSRYVIDKSVKFVGEGDISDAVKRGWLAKVFDYFSPF